MTRGHTDPCLYTACESSLRQPFFDVVLAFSHIIPRKGKLSIFQEEKRKKKKASLPRNMQHPSSGQRGPGCFSHLWLSEMGGNPPASPRPHLVSTGLTNTGATFYTAWYCTREPAHTLPRKENKCQPCSDGRPITDALQPRRHCSYSLRFPRSTAGRL